MTSIKIEILCKSEKRGKDFEEDIKRMLAHYPFNTWDFKVLFKKSEDYDPHIEISSDDQRMAKATIELLSNTFKSIKIELVEWK